MRPMGWSEGWSKGKLLELSRGQQSPTEDAVSTSKTSQQGVTGQSCSTTQLGVAGPLRGVWSRRSWLTRGGARSAELRVTPRHTHTHTHTHTERSGGVDEDGIMVKQRCRVSGRGHWRV